MGEAGTNGTGRHGAARDGVPRSVPARSGGPTGAARGVPVRAAVRPDERAGTDLVVQVASDADELVGDSGDTPVPDLSPETGALTRDGESRDSGDRPPRVRTSWSAPELIATEFSDPRWAVPGLVTEGVTLLAGPPKAGKSWMALGIAVAVAAGGKALGRIDVEPGPVLYLALEDTPRRLKRRLAKILGPSTPPPDLTIAVECPPLPSGGDERIAGWLDHHTEARLVIIDVFTKVRGPYLRDTSAYDADYAAVTRAKEIADRYGVALVLIAHTRKADAEDFIETVSGTTGMTGAADAVLVLQRTRGRADGILSVTGRDIDEAEYALRFAADLGAWQLIDTPAAELRRTDTERTILTWLRANAGTGPKQVADGTTLDHELTKKTMRRMAQRGHLDTNDQGHYWVPVDDPPEGVPAVPAVPVPGQSTIFRGQAGDRGVPAVPDDGEGGDW